MLNDLSAYVQDRGWIVPASLAITDTGPLHQDHSTRTGWKRVQAAAGRLIHGVVVPSLTHLTSRTTDRERTLLLKQGQFIIATDPTEPAPMA
ncbi:hypothetical protein [Streptomyces sp. NPDC088180]|uniref:hypothetical protein n=1 Tax=Streptomyces sp. NPDC088180 TaxID=3365837 RepID=UPI00380B3352